MLGKTEVKVVKPRGDGRHCDLCGCSFPAVRCDKCGSQIFCLSCDDMYHRHPKRRYHLRKAVDPTPTPQARPVLPMKVSQLNATPGDPSKMPLPPPRKKKPGKSFFDSFRRGSPSSDNSPPLPKKEYSWSDRLGSIKKFMSNRPLPPLPKDEEDNQEQKNSPPIPRKSDMSFIHKRVDEKPPQLPHRTQQAKSPPRKHSEGDILSRNQEIHTPDKNADWTSGFVPPVNNFQHTPLTPPTHHLNGLMSRDSSERELSSGRLRSKSFQNEVPPAGFSNFPEPADLSPTMPPDVRGYSTLKRPPTHGQDAHNQSFMSVPGDHFTGMHASSSFTDLHTLDSPTSRGPQQFPNFPMPPHHYPHPYPMYPHYPNYPQYFGTSFANLSTALPSTDGDFSDHSDASSFSSRKHKHSAFGIKAKRSQSVIMPAYPPQYYPFGGFPPPHPPLPGYGAAPWGQTDHPVEAPPSPATSIRSFGRSHKSRHRKKKTVASDNDDEDERLSVRSSPRSRTTSSSDRLRRRKTPKKIERSASPSSLTSSEEGEEYQKKEDRLSPETHMDFSQSDGYQMKQDKKKVSKQTKDAAKSEHKTKQHGSKVRAISHQKLKTDDKNFSPKFKKKEKAHSSSGESMDVNEEHMEPPTENQVNDQYDAEMKEESDYHSEEDVEKVKQVEEVKHESTLSHGQWQCEHCTFINNIEHRICQVCCKTKPGSVPQSDPISLLVPEVQTSSSAAASPLLNTTSESLTSDTAKEFLTPPVPAEDEGHSGQSESEGQNFAKLNSDLEQAEKELSRGLMELMKLKEESEIANSTQAANRQLLSSIPAADREVSITQNTQTEPTSTISEKETSLPQTNARMEAPSEQSFQLPELHPNIPKSENVSSKSIGTDSMDFDLVTHQTKSQENILFPEAKSTNFGLFPVDQVSPANSFSEITSSAPTGQKETAAKSAFRRDSSCQTHQDGSGMQIDNDMITQTHADNIEFQYPYNRADAMRSPQLPPIAPSSYRGFGGRGQGLMQRSHSRPSLFGDRYGDARNAPPEFDNLGFGFGPSPMYRSLSRSSLTGDFSDPWMSEVRPLRRPDFYLSMEELVERRRLESKRTQGLELVRMIREAEQQGFTADDIHVALNNCGKQNPVDWLQTNWKGMVDTVVTLATNYGKDKHENDIGVLSDNEARDSLRMHKGNIWAAVTECVEGRQRKFLELRARGNFSTKEIVDALTQSEGNVELAYTRLSATTLKPFLMRIWGTGEGVENQDGAVCDPAEFLDPESSGWPKNSALRAGNVPYGDAERCSDQEDWDDDEDVEEEVSWNEDEEDEMENPENFDIEPQMLKPEKRSFASNNLASPESDSEYCDAFDPAGDARSATSSSPVDEIFFVSPDSDTELQKDKKKGTSFLSRLASLRKNKKPRAEDIKDGDYTAQSRNQEASSSDDLDASEKSNMSDIKIRANDSNSSSSETNKIYSPLNILKQTFSAIKDSVIGSNNKNEAKHPRSITEARTIIVQGKPSGHETVLSEENSRKTKSGDANKDPPPHTEHKKEISESSGKSEQKKDLVRVHNTENSTSKRDSNALPSTFVAIPHEQTTSVSNSLAKVPSVKQQNSKKFGQETRRITDAESIQDNAQNSSVLENSGSKSMQNSLPVLTQTVPVESAGHVTMKEERLFAQENKNIPTDLKVEVQDSPPIIKEAEGDKFLEQEKCLVVPDKGAGSANNTDKSHLQTPSPKHLDTENSNEINMEAIEKHGSGIDNSNKDANRPVTGVNDVSIDNDNRATAKSPKVKLAKSSDSKQKTNKQREGLRLKSLEQTEKSLSQTGKQTEKSLSQTGKQTGDLPTKANIIPKADVYLEEKPTEDLQEENNKTVTAASESYSVPAESINEFQKPQREAADFFQGEPADDNNSTTSVREKSGEKVETSEELKTNISENEFHDMASKITEKLENCLEVLKSSETDFTESKQNIPYLSEKVQEVASTTKIGEVETDSFDSKSETVKEKDDRINTGIPEIPIDHKKEKEHAEVSKIHSPSLKKNEIPSTDNVSQTAGTIPEAAVSAEKHLSTGSIKNNVILDGKTLEQPSSINALPNDKPAISNSSDKVSVISASVTSTESDKASVISASVTSTESDRASVISASVTSTEFDKPSVISASVTSTESDKASVTSASVTSTESPAPQTVSSSAIDRNSDSSAETPVIFEGVKAKTFTGNKKPRGQLYGNEKKQNDVSIESPSPKATPDVTLSGEISTDSKNSIDEKQISLKTEEQQVTQFHQNETEQRIHSITAKEENKSSVSSEDDQRSQTATDGPKDASPFPVLTESKATVSSEITTTDMSQQISHLSEEKTPVSPEENSTTITEGSTESKSQVADPSSQANAKGKKDFPVVTKKEVPIFAGGRFAIWKAKELDAMNASGSIKSETSSKIFDVKAKQQQRRYSATATTKSEVALSASRRHSDISAVEQRGKDARAVAASKSEALLPASTKDSDTKAKEQEQRDSTTEAVAGNEASVSTSAKDSGIKAKDQDWENTTTTAVVKNEESLSSSTKDSSIIEKEGKELSTSSSTKNEASLSASAEDSDIIANEQDLENATTMPAIKNDELPSSSTKDSSIKENEEDEERSPSSSAENEALPSTSKEDLDIKSKEEDEKNATIAVSASKASHSSSDKDSDIRSKKQDEKNAAAGTESSVSSLKEKEQQIESAMPTSDIEEPVSASGSSNSKSEDHDTKIDTAVDDTGATAGVSEKDADSKASQKDTENAVASSSGVDTTASRRRLRMEIQATENFSMKDDSVPSSPVTFGDKRHVGRVDALRNSSNEGRESSQGRSQSPLRAQSPFSRMSSLSARKEAIAQERNKEVRNTPTTEKKPWFIEKTPAPKVTLPKRSIKQQLEFERKIRNLVSDRKCRTYRKAEIVVQLQELNFTEEEALQAAHECSTLEQAVSYLQQECLLCTGMYPVGQIVSLIHCPHKACRECIKAYFTIQIRDRTIMELLCPFCNEPDLSDEDVAQDYFNHLDILLKKLVETEIHELFQRKLRDRVLMKDPNFRWCSQCSSGFISMPNLKRLICPDCNAITCAKCRRRWERDHEGISCEAFAAWKDSTDPETHTAGLAKLLQEDGIDCPSCHFRYSLAKGGCMHFRCIQCQHDFCSGCSKPFKMGKKCGVSEFCAKLGLHAHHPRNCLFYLRDKDPIDLQKLLNLNCVTYNKDPPQGTELSACQVMEQKETSDGLVDDICGKEVEEGQAGLCRVHYVEYLGQLVNKNKIDPIQIFCNDDLELVLKRASKRLPAKSYRETEIKYREKLVQLIQEELPLELTEGS